MKDKKNDATPRFVIKFNNDVFFDDYCDLKTAVGMALSLHETSNVSHCIRIYRSASGIAFLTLSKDA